MTEPVPPLVEPPGGAVQGPDGTLTFPDPSGGDHAAAAGLAPVAPGFPQPAPRAPAPPQVGSGQFTVDLERAPQALRELKAAQTRLESLQQDSLLLSNVVPPSADSVSRDAAAALGAVATMGPGSFHAALGAGLRKLRSIIEKVEAELRLYGQTEADATSEMQERA